MNNFINPTWDDKYICLTSNKESFKKLRLAICNLSQSYLAYCKGSECVNEESFHETMQKILQFPDYYGKNKMALDECINDLGWLWNYDMNIIFDDNQGKQAIKTIFFLIEDFEKMFQNEQNQHEQISNFIALLCKTKEKWERGSCFSPWDLSYPIFFKIHLHCMQSYTQIYQAIERGVAYFNQSRNFCIKEIENYQDVNK